MSDTLHRVAMRDAWVASLRRLRVREQQLRSWLASGWTPGVAVIVIGAALLFAWGFLKLVLVLVFPRSMTYWR